MLRGKRGNKRDKDKCPQHLLFNAFALGRLSFTIGSPMSIGGNDTI